MARDDRRARTSSAGPQFGGLYLLTIIGAAVYFVNQADGFWGVVLALLKALVWPAFAIYRVFELIHL